MNEAHCDCCEGTQVLTPVDVANRPGLTTLAYRVGTHARFLETMKARLASIALDDPDRETTTAPSPIFPLRKLTTRAADDAAIALLDSWATVADVLTFYQERIANEGYLRTASERRSVLELARLVGYALRPGVASTVYLAYTIDENQQTPVEIPVGTRAQSVPGPGELPQSFETGEVLDARAAWNILTPRLSQPQKLDAVRTDGMLYLKGITTNLKPNDSLLLVEGKRQEFKRVLDVQTDAENDRTLIVLPATPVAMLQQPEFAQELRAVTKKYLATSDFGVDPNGAMARRVVALLRDLKTNATDEAEIDVLAEQVLKDCLRPSKVMLERAVRFGYRRLENWLRGIVNDLSQLLAATGVAKTEVGNRCNRPVHQDPGNRDANQDDLLDVVRGLSIPPSVPPANMLQLARNVSDTFAVNADGGLQDGGLQVVNAVQPDFKHNLVAALENVQVTDPNPLQVYALRLKTGVYGNTAPLKPITDREGRVIGQQEWPLNGTLSVGVDLSHWRTGHPTDAAISVARGQLVNTQRVVLSSAAETRVILNGVDFTFDKLPSQILEAPASMVPYKVIYSGNGGTVSLTYTLKTDNTVDVAISVDGRQAETINIAFDQTTSATLQSHSWKIEYFMDNSEAVVLSVIDVAPLPPSPRDVIALDGTYDQIAPQSWYVIEHPDGVQHIGQVKDAKTVAKTDYNFPAKVTQLTLATADGASQDWLTDHDLLLSDIRSTTVYAQSALLELADEPMVDPICGGAEEEIELDGLYSDLKSGRWLIVAGDRSDIEYEKDNIVSGLKSAELVMLTGVRHGYRVGLPGDKTHTFITLAEKLAFCYQRDTVKIYGNVVKATHGETRRELLGNGDGSRAFQSFDLKQPPVTYVAAPNPSGVDSTLHVYVNEVEWHEVGTLAGLAATDRSFITRTDDAGKTAVVFGNGKQGARLPTGAANVRAVYRNGIGSPGNVRAEQISLLASRPLGVKEVINPLRASGGADREGRDQARRNAPLALTALDRLVSVQDYADFARTFAGIGKASAQRLTDGRRALVHLTIAGADDIPIDPSSDLYRNLVVALHTFGDPDLPIQVDTRELLLLVMSATVYLQPDYVWEPVVTRVRSRLLEAFSFENRELGQDALLSEAMAAIQATPGVAYVDVDIFDGIPEKTGDASGGRRLMTPHEITQLVGKLAPPPQPRITVNLAEVNGTTIPAQLAMFSPLVPDTLILNRG